MSQPSLRVVFSSLCWIMKRRYIPHALLMSTPLPIAITVICFIYMEPTEKILSDYREEVIAALDMDLTEVFYLGGQFIVGLRH